MILHAGLIARRVDGFWRGVLIEGASGSGKSDLALKALAAGWRLVADDRTIVWRDAGRLWGRAPDPLSGLIEARGLGVLPASRLPIAEIVLVVRCAGADAVERMPEPARWSALGTELPLVVLAALEESATAKLDRALGRIGLDRQSAYQAPRAGQGSAGRGRGPVRFPT